MAALATSYKQTKVYPSDRSLWVVGLNHQGEFGIGNKKAQKELIKCDWSQNIQIRNIHVADQYTLVEDTDDNYYAAGYNASGACTVNDRSMHILTMTPITCLKEHNLKISQVFVNNIGRAPFWKTENGSIYTSYKSNFRGNIGVKVDITKVITKIPFLSQLSIKKMVSGYGCSIAICNDGSVYSTGHGSGKGDNGLGEKGKTNESWQRIECVKDIIDCDFGDDFIIFLSSSGQVFSAGLNDGGQLGLNTKEDEHIMRNPTEIKYFSQNNIIIQSISCCFSSVFALESNGHVYRWGNRHILCPRRLELKEKIQSIDTGKSHCILRTTNGQFMCIGRNSFGECFQDKGKGNAPQVIDELILNKISEGTILSVTPGWSSTFVLCTNTDVFEADQKGRNLNADEEEKMASAQQQDVNLENNKKKENKLNEVESENKNEEVNEDIDEDEHKNEDDNVCVEKQFKSFLSQSKMLRYFDKFVDNDCCNMQAIRYFDDEFLREDIGIKSKIARKTFIRECNKMTQRMDAFENNYGITTVIYRKLEKYGVVTIPILCEQVQSRDDLKRKFKITNDYHCDLLLQIIQKENGDGAAPSGNKNKQHCEDQQEGGDSTAWI